MPGIPMPGIPMPGMPIPVRSIIMLVICVTPFCPVQPASAREPEERPTPDRPALARTFARSRSGEYTHRDRLTAIVFFGESADLSELGQVHRFDQETAL